MGRKNEKYTIALTFTDETVDNGYIGIYSLFTDKKYALPEYDAEEWCLSEKRLRELRFKTFNEVKKRFKQSGVKSFSSFWNGNLDSINGLGLNEFDKLLCFNELSSIMVCFEKVVENKRVEGKRIMVSFGINKDMYREYYQSHLIALKTGEKPKKVKLYDRKKRLRNDLFQGKQIKADVGGIEVKVSNNALMEQFEHWRKLKGLKRTEAIYMAVENLLEKYPLSEVKDRNVYRKDTDVNNKNTFEIIIANQAIDEEETKNINVKIPINVYNKMKAIIARYNNDIDNIAKPELTVKSYTTQAINHFNNSIPLKYSNPKEYQEYKEIKEIQEYNNRVARR